MDKKRKSTSKPSSGSKPGAKKKKSSARKSKKTPELFVSKYPPIDYTVLTDIPQISLNIRTDLGMNNFMNLRMPINNTLGKLIEIINNKHSNACHSIRLYVIENSTKKYLDMFKYKTFKEIGIQPDDNLIIYYEFEPCVHPMLEAGLV